jgi:DNA helicase-2/ATP-dependent DNA helicase PcrA
VEWSSFPDEVAEAQGVVARIKELQASGVSLGEMAILFRINAASENFEAALSEADIPYVVRGAARFFERQEIRQAIALMRGQVRSGVADDDLVAHVAEVLAGLGWTSQVPRVGGQARERWESLQAMLDLGGGLRGAENAELGTGGHSWPSWTGVAAEQHAPSCRQGHLGHDAHREGAGVGCGLRGRGLREGSVPITYAQRS